MRRTTDFVTELKPLHCNLLEDRRATPTVGGRVRLAKGVGSKVGAVGETLQDDRDHLPWSLLAVSH